MFWVSSRWYAPTGGLIERFGIQRWVKNVVKARSGMEHVLGLIYLEEDEALESTSAESAPLYAKSAITKHPFIAEKRRMLKEAAAAMGNKAKTRLKQPMDHAKEKYEKTRDNAMEKYERTRDNAKVTIETAQDNLKANLGNS